MSAIRACLWRRTIPSKMEHHPPWLPAVALPLPFLAVLSFAVKLTAACGGSQTATTVQDENTIEPTGPIESTTFTTSGDDAASTTDGTSAAASVDMDAVIASYQQATFTDSAYNNETLMYSIYVPAGYDASRSYPLVLFMGDSSLIGSDPTKTLTSAYGATIWATPAEQAKHECIVVVPQYDTGTPVVNDSSEATEYLDITVDLVKYIETQYSVDPNRIYNTGQSMGGMMSIAMDIKYPGMFAASLLVGCQWDATLVTPMVGDNLWIVVSEGDRKAYPGMNAITQTLKDAGATVSSGTWSRDSTAAEFATDVSQMLAQGSNVKYTVLTNGDHMSTFDKAYSIEGIRDWLFAQTNPSAASTSTRSPEDRR